MKVYQLCYTRNVKLSRNFTTVTPLSKTLVLIIFILFPFIAFYLGTSYQKTFEDTTNKQLYPGVSNTQIKHSVFLDGEKYVIYQKSSINIPINSKNSQSGVLHEIEDGVYERTIAIIDVAGYSGNNVYSVWKENGKLYILVVDAHGAGSGEGYGKVLSTSNDGGSWTRELCFYYTPEDLFKKTITLVNILNIIKTSEVNINNVIPGSEYCSNYMIY